MICNLAFISFCNKCHQEIACKTTERPKEFAEQIKELASLYDRKIVNEDAYHDLLRLFISMHVANTVSSQVTCELDKTLEEKFTPHRFLEALI